MWKHKTKWLVRGGRKVRCYLCGKKILAKGDLFLFHQDTGYYSHQSCLAESTTISGNERRRAVKTIAIGAAVVGAIAAGAGKFLDVSSQSKNSPAAQTILTSQGLIPPALTSDPSNPVPGQMWYRSDAGVEAHFDGVQNRVVYSSEINDGNVHVTSKGIINGLSVLPNDGKGGFGPDTTKGATAPGQYGSPYSETIGNQEAINYGIANNVKVKVLAGVYKFTGPNPSPSLGSNFVFLTIPNTGSYGIDIEGEVDTNLLGNTYGVIWDLESLPSPTTNNSWYAFGFENAIANVTGFISLKNVTILTPQNVGFVFGQSCDGSVYENIYGSASSVATLSNSAGFVIDGYLTNISWANNLFANNIYNGYWVSHSHLTAGTLNASNCQIALAINIITNENSLGSVILKLNTGNCGTQIMAYPGGTPTTSAKAHIVQINDFTTPYNSPVTLGIDFDDSSNLLSVDIDVFNHPNQETSTSNYNWLLPTYNGGQYIRVHNIMGITGKLYFAPTTPSVPTSATAQENTNPYAVDVYVYGGDVTEIQITKGGTAYTVFSVSTAIAMSGQAYKLNPGDSITVTYSTAPTWEWLSD